MPEANDILSIAAGKSQCGPVLYSANVKNGVANFNPKNKQLEFLTKNGVGIYQGKFSIEVKATLMNYPKVAALSFHYNYELLPCLVRTVSPTMDPIELTVVINGDGK